jgi:hypothetical protein
MIGSLAVPTATSVRSVPVKLLEENRRLINHHQATIAGPKISFTHLIAWAVVRCLVKHPVLNSGYLESASASFWCPVSVTPQAWISHPSCPPTTTWCSALGRTG